MSTAQCSRRILIRNLPSHSTRDSLYQFFSRYGDIREVFIPTDPTTKKPRAYGFVEFKQMKDAQTVYDTVTEVDNQRVTVVFVEPKRDDAVTATTGASHTSKVNVPIVAPPPPSNPNTETYRYNTLAGEFTIDGSGRLTRKLVHGEESKHSSKKEIKGIGVGLLSAVNTKKRVLSEDADDDEFLVDSLKQVSHNSSILKASDVIDFRDI
jgi:RNA recognition motif. (a.k.a. RRM, RBD, or RNP domain)